MATLLSEFDPTVAISEQMNIRPYDDPFDESFSSSSKMCQSSDSSNGSPSVFVDDSHIYTNVKEIDDVNSRPTPPTPTFDAVPKRDLQNGWFEYETELGRTYFHNKESGKSQWIPPRFIRTPAQVKAFLAATRQDMDENCTIQAEEMAEKVPPVDNQNNSPMRKESTESETKIVEEEVFDEPADDGFSDYDDFDEEDVQPAMSQQEDVKPYVALSTFHSADASVHHLMTSSTSSNHSISSSTRARKPSPSSHRSLSFNNRGVSVGGLKHVPMPQIVPTSSTTEMTQTLDRFKVKEQRSASVVSRDSEPLFECKETVRTVRSGDMERYEIKDEQPRSKKREWIGNFLYLTSAHLIVYKDQKSAEKHGKHYEAPMDVWDLRGAKVSWFTEKEKKKRKSILLEVPEKGRYQLRSSNDSETTEWMTALSSVLSALPSHVNDGTTTVARNPSVLSMRPMSQAICLHKPSRFDSMTQSAIEVCTSAAAGDENRPSKETILEKLRRFFRNRPSVDSLKEKGIYKPESVFGSTLAAICLHENSYVPKFIRVVIEVIESKGLELDGIYRVSGNLSAVQKIRCQADQDNYRALVAEEDIHVLTGALKLFFRELSEPLFPVSMQKEYISAMQMPNVSNRFKKFEELLNRLPSENRETLKTLLRHLNLVANHSKKNRMQQHNLAIVFGPTLFHSGEAANAKNKKSTKKKSSKKEEATPIQSNSHMAFNMIMQGQIVQFLLESANKFEILRAPIQITRC